jgi:hypothetical protein
MNAGNALQSSAHPEWMWAFVALMCFAVYRRLRRNFGRQALRPARLGVRIGLFALVCLALAPRSISSGSSLLASLAGAAGGIAIAVFASRHTRFEWQGGQLYYLPHTYSGVAISLLLVGRILYRLISVYATGGPDFAGTAAVSPDSMVQGPLTLGLLFVVVGYYVYYFSHLLWKSKHVTPHDIEPASMATDEPTRNAGQGG